MTAATARLATDVEPATPIRQGVRLQAIDILRGLVIMLMVIDHVRDFFHAPVFQGIDPLDLERSNPWVFATRWVTHFCAPTFVFLAGASAWLQAYKGKTPGQLAGFLFTRGLWLVILELTVVNLGWSFTIGLPFLQVIWAIGASMILLAGLVALRLPARAILALGVLIVAGHNALAPVDAALDTPLWNLMHEPGLVARIPGVEGGFGGGVIFGAYPLLPWFGVMLCGYGLAWLWVEPEAKRDRGFMVLGLAMIAAFVALRWSNLYGDPGPWAVQGETWQTIGSFLSVQKYPPSLLYVLATLGPVLALVPLWSRLKGPLAELFLTYGRVPLFAYVLHIFIAHAIMMAVGVAMGRDASEFQAFLGEEQALQGWGFPLWVVYAVWITVLAILFPLCRWFGALKRRRTDWWLSYL